ncbi:CRISPR-associated protein Csm2 [Gammaproteobacteria bacterium]
MVQDYRPQRSSPGGRPFARQEESAPLPQFTRIIFSGQPLNPELFNSIALESAQAVSRSDTQRNKSTQLRRFYDELVLWENRANQQPGKFDEYLPFIRMLNAKAAYAEGRKLVDRTFVALLRHTLAEVKDAASLTACKLFWEAFMGFYKQERQD